MAAARDTHKDAISRRDFLLSLLSASALVLLDAPMHAGSSRPVIAAVNRRELGRFSGDAFFEQMHTELLGRKREGTRRTYPSERSAEKIDVVIVGGGIAGLDTAYYLLTDPGVRKSGAVVRLFEMDDEVGGTAKEYAWEGIPYSNSAAYFYLSEPDSPDMRLYRDIGILGEVSVPMGKEKESLFIGDRLYDDFFREGRGDARETAAMRALSAFFETLLEDALPDVPFDPAGAYGRDEFSRLDRLSLGAFLERRGSVRLKGRTLRLPEVPAIYREFMENYCYSSFGCSADETSAWQGLNWFCSEFEEKGVGVAPGGNGRVTTRLREKIEKLDPGCLRTAMPVVDVRHDSKSGLEEVTVAMRSGGVTTGYRTFTARCVVMCSPLVVSKRLLLHEMPGKYLRAVERFRYSAYIVANAFIDGFILPDYWDTYCLSGHRSPGKAGAALYRTQPFMDIINAAWPLRTRSGAPPPRTVLTIYCPHPFDGQRQDLLSDEYCEGYRRKVRDELVRRLGPQGLKASSIVDLRIARWGHAMFQATPGILSSGILDEIRASVAGKGIFFAGTEFAGAPTIENCHLTARDAASKAAARLKAGKRK